MPPLSIGDVGEIDDITFNSKGSTCGPDRTAHHPEILDFELKNHENDRTEVKAVITCRAEHRRAENPLRESLGELQRVPSSPQLSCDQNIPVRKEPEARESTTTCKEEAEHSLEAKPLPEQKPLHYHTLSQTLKRICPQERGQIRRKAAWAPPHKM